MPSSEQQKTCIYCGTDVSHRERDKNRYGQYMCLPCIRRRQRWSVVFQGIWHFAKAVMICGSAVAVAVTIFWYFLQLVLHVIG